MLFEMKQIVYNYQRLGCFTVWQNNTWYIEHYNVQSVHLGNMAQSVVRWTPSVTLTFMHVISRLLNVENVIYADYLAKCLEIHWWLRNLQICRQFCQTDSTVTMTFEVKVTNQDLNPTNWVIDRHCNVYLPKGEYKHINGSSNLSSM